ncbi:MAG: B12-binding domain-containing radical SAM protein [Candidatus Hodarchaeota archaeon]
MMVNKKLLFIYPASNRATRKIEEKNQKISGFKYPIELSFAYLDAYLKEKIPSIETSYLDFRVEDPTKIAQKLLEIKSEFDFTHVAITCYSRHFLQIKELAKWVKEIDSQISTIVGGVHPTINPSEFQDNDVFIDYIIQGEGEIPLYQVMMEDGAPKTKKVLCHDRPIDINKFPLINLELYNNYKKKLDFKKLYIYFSRGCINECIFCAGRKESCNMKAYRFLDPERAFEQLRIFEEYQPNWLIIQDPIFGVNEKWLIKIAERIGKRKLDYRISAEIHADLASKERLDAITNNKMDLTIGFESASPTMLKIMNKTKDPISYVKNMERILDHFKDKDQVLNMNTIVMHPGETRETLDQTFDFFKKNTDIFHHALVKINLFRLFPGSPLYNSIDTFEREYGTKVYCKDWWLHDIDHFTTPSLVDPSKDLDFLGGIEHVYHRVKDLVMNGVTKSKNVPDQFKLGAIRFLKNVEKSYEHLVEYKKKFTQNIP